ncbi:MAG: hypothetical protein ABJE95_26275 [Byssovorax sp.]
MRHHVVIGLALATLAPLGASCHGSAGGSGGSGAGGASSATSGSAGGDVSFIDAGDGDGAMSTGCSDAAPEPPADAATGCEGLDGGVTFQHDVAPIFNLGCNGEQCHAIPTWKGLVSRPSSECCDRLLVTPGDPTHSYLVDKVTGVSLCSGDPMPLSRPPLSISEITTIRRWICEGALDD